MTHWDVYALRSPCECYQREGQDENSHVHVQVSMYTAVHFAFIVSIFHNLIEIYTSEILFVEKDIAHPASPALVDIAIFLIKKTDKM